LRDKHCKMVGVEQFNKRRGIHRLVVKDFDLSIERFEVLFFE